MSSSSHRSPDREPATALSNQDPLLRELKALPSVSSSPGFTERVLGRLDEPERSVSAVSSRLVWTGAAAVVALLAAITLLPDGRSAREASEGVTASEFRRQHALLSEELDRLRSRTDEMAPVLYLGSDDEVDYVLDLSPFLLPEAAGVRPASSDSSSTF